MKDMAERGVPKNKKFSIKEKLSDRGKELIGLAKEYQDCEKPVIKDAIKRAIEADHKKYFDVSLLDTLDIAEIESHVRSQKYFEKNADEVAAEAVLWAENYFKGGDITITPEKRNKIRICRKYGVKRSQVTELFGVTSGKDIMNLWRGGFVETFVDKYVRTKIINILSDVKMDKKFNFEIGRVYFNERFYNIDVSITVAIEDLDSDTLVAFRDILRRLIHIY